MILGGFGHDASIQNLRREAGVTSENASVLELKAVAERHGLVATGLRIDPDHLAHQPGPLMLHWRKGHYVVFEGPARDGVWVADPAEGRRLVRFAELREQFSGLALAFHRGPTFRKRRRAPALVRLLGGGAPARPAWARLVGVAALLQGFALLFPALLGVVVDRVLPQRDTALLAGAALGIAVVACLYFGLAWLRAELRLRMRLALDRRLVAKSLQHLLALPLGALNRRTVGDLGMRLESATWLRDMALQGVVSVFLDATFLIGASVALLLVNPRIAVGVGAFAALRLGLALSSRRALETVAQQEMLARTDQATFQVRVLEQLEGVKASGMERTVFAGWRERFESALHVGARSARVDAWFDTSQAVLGLVGPIVLLFLGAHEVMRGAVSPGAMLAVVSLGALTLGPVTSLAAAAAQLAQVHVWVERLEDLSQRPEQGEPDRPAPSRAATRASVRNGLPAPQSAGGAQDVTLRRRGALELSGIRFRPRRGMPVLLQDVDLSVQPGECVVITGRSGGGKTSLLRVALGLVEPEAGTVRFEGVPLAELDPAVLRRRVGAVLPTAAVLPGSVRANLLLADPSASHERLESVTRLACLHDDILQLARGYDTELGDGISLSSGQRQRFALARALLCEPALLVLDEPTSHLDRDTEAQVLRHLASLSAARLIVGHGDAVGRQADRVLLLEHGRLREIARRTPAAPPVNGATPFLPPHVADPLCQTAPRQTATRPGAS